MKFGLEFRNNELAADYGGIGEYIKASLPSDVYLLEDLLNKIKTNNSNIKVQSTDYKYLLVNPDITTAYFYNEFDVDFPSIEMGFLYTIDLLSVIEDYILFLRNENLELYKKLDDFYSILIPFLEEKKEIIKILWRSSKNVKILLSEGKEVVQMDYIVKTYELLFREEKLYVKKNRQYKNDDAKEFYFTNKGLDSLISFLDRDIEHWYCEKMKMHYKGNQLIIEKDDNLC